MSRSRTDAVLRLCVLAAALAAAGCSDLYTDRRETIALSAGDAIAANQVTHMVDPWPRSSANKNIAFNGEKVQSAVERYRTGRIIQPVSAMTSSANYQAPPPNNGTPQSGQQSTKPAGNP